jgi:hypothetical protein
MSDEIEYLTFQKYFRLTDDGKKIYDTDLIREDMEAELEFLEKQNENEQGD